MGGAAATGAPRAGSAWTRHSGHHRGHGHHHHHHSHSHFGLGLYFSGAPWYYPYPAYYPYWPYYGYAPYHESLPVSWIEKRDLYWHYCAPLQAYHPYVTECPNGEWQRVEPYPAPGSDTPVDAKDMPD